MPHRLLTEAVMSEERTTLGAGSVMLQPMGRDAVRVATLNTRGMPMIGSHLRARYEAIGSHLAASSLDVVAFQEVHTYFHLQALTTGLGSLSAVSYRPSVLGPAGGLVTAARATVRTTAYQPFGDRTAAAGLPLRAQLTAVIKGVLLTRLTEPDVWIVNTHPSPNTDGDWSAGSRFARLQQRQLTVLSEVIRCLDAPIVVCGDFNVARGSQTHRGFMTASRLVDAFGGECPPTYRAEYLPSDRDAQCIDFILTDSSMTAADTGLLFTDPVRLPRGPGHVSDHIGLQATLRLPRASVQPGLSTARHA